jgi:hypothetical protein
MSHESNWAGKVGTQNPGQGADYFQKGGMSGTQAAEAAAAAARAKSGGNKK